jgi:hypothetical protein
LIWREVVFAQGAALALAALAVVFLLAPSTIKGGTFVEGRLALMFVLLVLQAFSPVSRGVRLRSRVSSSPR